MEKQAYNRIKAVLAENRRTNNWLADKLNMNRTTVSKWCRNEMHFCANEKSVYIKIQY